MSPVTLRTWHSYIGLFIAPSVLFFALTGGVQIFNLHESHGGYQPAAILEKLSSVHKDQVFAFGDHHAAPGAAGPGPQDDDAGTPAATLLLKWFFLAVSVALVVSTCFGVWLGLTQVRRRRTSWLLLIAGTVIPVGMLVL